MIRARLFWQQVLGGICAASVVGMLPPVPARAATVIVDTLLDKADPPFDADDTCGTGSVNDLPGADGHVSLREAIIATNNTPGPHTITFLESLQGGTMRIDFDDTDADPDPDPLPWLCWGDVSVNGDINDDGTPDITLTPGGLPAAAVGLEIASHNNRIAGLVLEGFTGTAVQIGRAGSVLDGNRLTQNVLRDNGNAILLMADSGGLPSGGLLTDVSVSQNVIEGTSTDAIRLVIGPAAGSEMDRVDVADNQIVDTMQSGITVILGGDGDGAQTAFLDSSIRGNVIVGSGSEGIVVRCAGGRGHAVRGLEVSRNQVSNSGGAGIALANVCGATDSVVEATVSDNDVRRSGGTIRLPGIVLVGGSNFECVGQPAAQQNRLTATVDGNLLDENAGGHLVVLGGQVGANDNMVAVTLTNNIATDAGLVGIGVIGGQGTYEGRTAAADRNRVRAALSGNEVSTTLGGILVSGGNGGPASDNHVDLIMETNRACMNTISDISCLGAFPGGVGFPANVGTGNVVNGEIRDSEASVILADAGLPDNACGAVLENNRRCGEPTPTPTVVPPRCVGDCDVTGAVTIDEIIAMVNIALGTLPTSACLPGDNNRDNAITIEEILMAVNRALLGC